MSFDSYASATSPHGPTLSSLHSEAYVRGLEAQVEALRQALANEQAKTRKLEEVNAMLEANAQSVSISSISSISSSSGGSGDTIADGSIRARNKDLQHLHQEVLRVQDAIINYVSGFSLFRDSYVASDALGRSACAGAMSSVDAPPFGVRPDWLRGERSLSVVVKSYDDHVVHDLVAGMPPEVANVYETHRVDALEAISFYLSSTRYSMTTKCKRQLREIFGYLDLPDDIFVPGLDSRRESSKIAVLLGRGPNSAAISKQPPLIYGTLDGETQEVPFASKAIEKIIQCVMYGENSFTRAEGEWARSASAYKWGLSCVTPGTIAYAAIVAIYLLSGDKELSNTGDYSGFDYRTSFMIYVGSLWTSWTRGATARLVAQLNRKYFANLPNYPDSESSHRPATAAGSSTIEVSRDLLADLEGSGAPTNTEPIHVADLNSPVSPPPPSPFPEDHMPSQDLHDSSMPPLIAQEGASPAPLSLEPADARGSHGAGNVKGKGAAGGGQRRVSARGTDNVLEGTESAAVEQAAAKGAGKGTKKGKKSGSGSSSQVEPRATRSQARK